jgi:ferredoxin-NADP reductase
VTGELEPPAQLRRAELVVAEVLDESWDTKTFRLAAPPGGLPSFRAGQFFAIEVPGEDGWVRRSYSISSSPRRRDSIDFTVKMLPGGSASRLLFQRLAAGDLVRASGPFGEFLLDETRPALFVAGGVGITPILSMLRYLVEGPSGPPACLLYSNRAGRDVLFEKELRALASARPGFCFHFTLTRPEPEDLAGRWSGRSGRFDAAAVRELCAGMSDRVAYLCGPLPMMEEIGRALLELGIAPERVRTEAFVGTSPTF